MTREAVIAAAHAQHVCVYHVVWATKYRRKVLDIADGQISRRLKELVHEKAVERGWTVRAVEVMPDHVHVLIQVDQTSAPHHVASQLKGYTSRHLRDEFPVLVSKLPTLWTRSYFIATAGDVSAATISAYIASQRSRP